MPRCPYNKMEANTNRDRPTEASSEMEKKLADILAARNAQDGALWGISGAAISAAQTPVDTTTCTSAAPKHPSSACSSSGKGRYAAS
jgi:hypothetical protein